MYPTCVGVQHLFIQNDIRVCWWLRCCFVTAQTASFWADWFEMSVFLHVHFTALVTQCCYKIIIQHSFILTAVVGHHFMFLKFWPWLTLAATVDRWNPIVRVWVRWTFWRPRTVPVHWKGSWALACDMPGMFISSSTLRISKSVELYYNKISSSSTYCHIILHRKHNYSRWKERLALNGSVKGSCIEYALRQATQTFQNSRGNKRQRVGTHLTDL